MATKKFVGFYLSLRDRRDTLDLHLWQFYTQLLTGLKLYNNHTVSIGQKQVLLTEDLFANDGEGLGTDDRINMDDDFVLFNGAYVGPFQDGSLMFAILQIIVETLGDSTAQLQDKLEQYKSEGKSCPHLRACYWYIDGNFVSQLPSDYEVAFTVDCLLYGEWRVNHPNLVGLHLLALAWMLGVAQFRQFMPEAMQPCQQVASPLFRHFLPRAGIQIRLDDSLTEPEDDG